MQGAASPTRGLPPNNSVHGSMPTMPASTRNFSSSGMDLPPSQRETDWNVTETPR